MKIREGYVSNSSSSSFILKNDDDIKLFKNIRPKTLIYKIKDIKEILKEYIKDYLNKTEEENNQIINNILNTNKVPYFIIDDYFRCPELFNIKCFIDDGDDDLYITDAVDRDWWSEYGIHKLECYQGDL